jgi:hypothetical protein
VKKKDPPKSAKSNNEMAAVPTGPTFPPSAVSNPGIILSGSSWRREPNPNGSSFTSPPLDEDELELDEDEVSAFSLSFSSPVVDCRTIVILFIPDRRRPIARVVDVTVVTVVITVIVVIVNRRRASVRPLPPDVTRMNGNEMRALFLFFMCLPPFTRRIDMPYLDHTPIRLTDSLTHTDIPTVIGHTVRITRNIKTYIHAPSRVLAVPLALWTAKTFFAPHTDSQIMSAFTVSSATAVRAPVRVAARNVASAKIARGAVLARYTVTLETPEGTQAIECADDTYILDAAEVRS